MLNYLFLNLGGAIRTAARFWISGMIANRFGEAFAAGTLLVDVSHYRHERRKAPE